MASWFFPKLVCAAMCAGGMHVTMRKCPGLCMGGFDVSILRTCIYFKSINLYSGNSELQESHSDQ